VNSLSEREHAPGKAVYRSSMIRGLAVLLLSTAAVPLGAAVAEVTPAPEPAPPATTIETPPEEATGGAPPPAAAPAESAAEPGAPGTAAADEPGSLLPLDPRMEAYDQFRALYETARFEEALPYAKRIVELSEADPDRDYELPIAYNNLGATQLKLSDYTASEASYRKSLELLESGHGISSRRLIVPLAGLGTVYAALDQHATAAEQFDRALAVSRRAEGLFNLEQLPLIEQAADSRYAIGDYGGVERERMYALKVLEQNYGYSDARTLPAALELAEFYESLQEFPAARGLYLRVRDVAMKESGGYNVAAVRAMIAICRTHRMQYTMDPDSLDDDVPVRDPITGQLVGRMYRTSRVPAPQADRTGLKSAEQAVEILRAAEDPPKELYAEALTELADWYQATSRPHQALPLYAEASTLYSTHEFTGKGNPLVAPRMIFYRAPLSSKRGVGNATGEIIIRSTVFSFVVTESGDTKDIQVVSSDMEDSQLSQSRRALSKAIYSPRFVDGKPVATEGVQFTSDWYVQQQPASSTPGSVSASGG
jgi:tetratricopeptide (TPR) repeat protein